MVFNIKNCYQKSTVCQNNDGSFECACKNSGFLKVTSGDHVCVDIDECTTDISGSQHQCPADSTCTNTFGSYICECNDGYNEMVKCGKTCGKTCESVNECTTGDHYCEALSTTCNELDGNAGKYNCECKAGFEKDPNNDYACIDIDECNPANREAFPCNPMDGSCVNTPGSFECKCKDGYELEDEVDKTLSDGTTVIKFQDCKNIDECSTKQG